MRSLIDGNIQLRHHRLKLMSMLVGLGLLVLATRLMMLQIIETNRYTTLSQKNVLTLIPMEPKRGLILDRHGQVLAENRLVYHLEVTPQYAKGLEHSIRLLQSWGYLEAQEYQRFLRFYQKRRPFEAIALKQNLTTSMMAKLALHLHKLPGFSLAARLQRYYPLGAITSHVLGYVGAIDAEELQTIDRGNYAASQSIGKTGIEYYYERQLHGQIGYQRVEVDAHAQVVRTLETHAPMAGQDLRLTLDAQLQTIAYQTMQAYQGALVAIELATGEVLAMVSTPSFDPNRLTEPQPKQSEAQHSMFHRAISGLYPLASTIKPFLALQGLEEALITPKYQIYDPGWYSLPASNYIFRDWSYHKGGCGWVNLKRSITISCDTYYYHLAYLLGIHRIERFLKLFGFGQRTAIDLPQESTGIIPSPSWKSQTRQQSWYGGDTVLTGIGQGYVAATPLQLALATAFLANQGKAMRPHLLQATRTPAQATWQMVHLESLAPIGLRHAKAWRLITEAMQAVIDAKEGTGWRFGRDAAYKVAAKTGTAQVVSTRGHPHTAQILPKALRDHSLFIAFAPTERPVIAIAVVIENDLAAPAVARMVLDEFFAKNKPP